MVPIISPHSHIHLHIIVFHSPVAVPHIARVLAIVYAHSGHPLETETFANVAGHLAQVDGTVGVPRYAVFAGLGGLADQGQALRVFYDEDLLRGVECAWLCDAHIFEYHDCLKSQLFVR